MLHFREKNVTAVGRRAVPVTALLLTLSLLLGACATMSPREKAAWGALGGTAAGAVTGAAVASSGQRTEGALIGGGIGAVVGGVGGYLLGKTEERQAPPPEVVVVQPAPAYDTVRVEIPGLAVEPQSIPAGAEVTIHGICQTVGRASTPPAGRIRLIKGDTLLHEADLLLSFTGRVDFTKTISLPRSSERGTYEVEVSLGYGPSQAIRAVTFRVY